MLRLTRKFIFLALLSGSLSVPAQVAEYSTGSLQTSEIFTTEEKALIASGKIFKICNVIQQANNDASPGIVKLIAAKSGLKLEASPLMSWADSLESLKTGNCDILPWATKTEERNKTMNFTRPYVRIKRVVISRKEEPYIRDLHEVKDRKFAMLRSNYLVKQIQNNYPDIQFVYVETVQDEIDQILQNKVYGTIVSLYSAANLFNNEEILELKVVGVLAPEYDDIASLATQKENAVLHSILEKSLISTNPRMIEEFMTKGAVVSYKPGVDYKEYWQLVIAVIVLVIFLVWWIRYLKALNVKLEESQRKLELLSVTDSLTKVFNRLKMDEVFIKEIETSKRYHSPLSIIMLDIDYFKKINDNHGHIVGDKVLKTIADLIKSNLRSIDFLGRWGGEEFLIICPSTNLVEAKQVAEKLRLLLIENDFTPLEKVTASFGVAEWQENESQESLISRADAALYRSKNEGRNKVSS